MSFSFDVKIATNLKPARVDYAICMLRETIFNLSGNYPDILIKNTLRYLHVSKKQLVNVMSPFDDLWKKEAIDW
jgi:hypothetical protein